MLHGWLAVCNARWFGERSRDCSLARWLGTLSRWNKPRDYRQSTVREDGDDTGYGKDYLFLAASARDWGGASRVLFTSLRLLDRTRYVPFVLLPYRGPIGEEFDSPVSSMLR